MGTLGKYLRDAREARGIDLHEAAQQTRIGITYLKALEEEDFSRLPGEVFVRGFLKNYGKYLHLDEKEVMIKFGELRPAKSAPGAPAEKEPAPAVSAQKMLRGTPVELFIWGAGIVIALVIFFFVALPKHGPREDQHAATPSSTGQLEPAPVPAAKQDKLYLEVVALEDTWLLVRTDTSPQKKAVLKKGESLIWSADGQFLLSFGSAGALKLLLNGQELTVIEPKNAVVRDLAVTATGIVSRKSPQESSAKPARPKRQPAALQRTQPSAPPAVNSLRPPEVKPQERTKPKEQPAPIAPAEPEPWEGPPTPAQ
jgi:hypothetical protein